MSSAASDQLELSQSTALAGTQLKVCHAGSPAIVASTTSKDTIRKPSNECPPEQPEECGQKCGSTKSSRKSNDSDSNEDPFANVLEHLKFQNISGLATSARMRTMGIKVHNSRMLRSPKYINLSCIVVPRYLYGSFNMVFPIGFHDGVRWLIKIPANGGSGWDEQSARALTSEVLTIEHIRKNTSIPLPRIFGYDASKDNPIRCPYILMERIDGEQCSYRWFGIGLDDTPIERFRERVLSELANAMVQLNSLTFPSAGSPWCEEADNSVAVGPCKYYDQTAILEGEPNMFSEKGPFVDAKDWFLVPLNKQDISKKQAYYQGLCKLLRILTGWFLQVTGDEGSSEFVLARPDFDLQNILVGEDGSLRGLIDWEGVAAVPQSIGCEAYPNFLTSDWDPFRWDYEEEKASSLPADEYPIMGPEELDRCRAMYARSVKKALATRARRAPSTSLMHESGTPSPHPHPSRTKVSCLARCLYLAAHEPMSRLSIMYMLLHKIIDLTSDFHEESEYSEDSSGSDTSSHGDSDLLSRTHNKYAVLDKILGFPSDVDEGSEDSSRSDIGSHDGSDDTNNTSLHDTEEHAPAGRYGHHNTKDTTAIDSDLLDQHQDRRAERQPGYIAPTVMLPCPKNIPQGVMAMVLLLLMLPAQMMLALDWMRSVPIHSTLILFLLKLAFRWPVTTILTFLFAGCVLTKLLDVFFLHVPTNASAQPRNGPIDDDAIPHNTLRTVEQCRSANANKITDAEALRARGIKIGEDGRRYYIEDGRMYDPGDELGDDGSFFAHEISHALFDGGLGEARMWRMKVGFVRLMAGLDERYEGLDPGRLREG
ncbi:MAG: hypothetical protein Q9208_005179 [Pyrenodesmia sp. 3 TL-2023]